MGLFEKTPEAFEFIRVMTQEDMMIYEEIKKEVSLLEKKPCLLVILVGDDQASQIYVASKEKACKRVGMESKTIVLEDNSLAALIFGDDENDEENIHDICEDSSSYRCCPGSFVLP